MMSSETLDVIKICKRHHTRSKEDISDYEALRQYYIDQYCIYSDHFEIIGLHALVKRAFYDLIDHADRPSNILRSFEDAMNMYQVMEFNEYAIDLAAMISALTMVQVRRGGEYINGFNDDILGTVILGGAI